MPKKMLLYPVIVTLLAACTGYRPPRFEPALYPRSYKAYDLAFAWKTGREGSDLMVEGFVRNNRYAYLQGLELTLELMDAEGRELSEATFFFIPDLVQLDDIKPFDLKLPVPPDSVPKHLKFRYKYYLAGDGGAYQTPYFYSFEAEL